MAFDPVKVNDVPRAPLNGEFFRLIKARYAHEPMSTIGSVKEGGRYNIQGDFGALYLGFDVETCQAEVNQGILAGLPIKPGAFVCWQFQADLNQVVHLIEDSTRGCLGLVLNDITVKGDRQWGAKLGLPLYDQGIEAIAAPSAHLDTGRCLAVYTNNVNPPSSMHATTRLGAWP